MNIQARVKRKLNFGASNHVKMFTRMLIGRKWCEPKKKGGPSLLPGRIKHVSMFLHCCIRVEHSLIYYFWINTLFPRKAFKLSEPGCCYSAVSTASLLNPTQKAFKLSS